LIISILLTCLFLSLEATEKKQPYIFSQKRILESFFEDLLENTTLGYVIYGQKPVELTGRTELDKTIPGTKEHYSSVKMFIGLERWNEIPANSKKNKYSFIQFSKNDCLNIIVINQQAFLKIITQNLLLFKYKFGSNFTAKDLLISLENSKNSFEDLFKEKIALLGIIFGYGVENAITYKNISSLEKILIANKPLDPPYKNPSLPKNEKEVKNQLKNSSSTKNAWAKLKEETKAEKEVAKQEVKPSEIEKISAGIGFLIQHSKDQDKEIEAIKKRQIRFETGRDDRFKEEAKESVEKIK